MSDQTIDRMAWCLRTYKNAADKGLPVSDDVKRTAVQALAEYDQMRADQLAHTQQTSFKPRI